MTVGPASRPRGCAVGPVIDADVAGPGRCGSSSRARRSKPGVAYAADASGNFGGRGLFRRPARSFADVARGARIAQEEVFGPILAVIRATDLDDALRIADDTPYALTGGLYSRSPQHIEKVKRRLRVGNVYINRPITGALVDRQPFGGFKLSGIGGAKAGGTDYLHEFLLTRAVTENTLRRGFAPESTVEADAATMAVGSV